MRVGIKQKILLVLIGVLAFTTALHALLASYYTNQQNQESAFAALDRDLLAWHNDLQAQTQGLQHVALSAAGDPILLKQLAELVTLELNVDDPLRAKEAPEMRRTLSYSKAVSLNRLHLVLQTAGFSSIAIYTNNNLSHYVSTADAGMMVRRGNAQSAWIRPDTGLAGEGSFQSWPAWQEGLPSPTVAHTIAEIKQPTVFFAFPSRDLAAIDIAVPVQGAIEEFLRDAAIQPLSRFVFELAIADPARNAAKGVSSQRPTTLAVLVFRKLIDRAALEDLAAKTGKWPVLFSPDGSHQQRLVDFHQTPKELLQQAQAASSGKTAVQAIRQTVTADQGSFYEALLPLQFENQTRLILGLTSSRDSTLQNIRQTVSAILIAASLILVLSVVVGIFWVERFIDPIIALTNAVKKIGLKRRVEGEQPARNGITAEELQPIVIEAQDEIGELSAAFNVMIAELRHSLETLEQRVQARTAELRQQTRYLRTLIDTLPLWVWLKDTGQRYLAANQANANACGRSVDEMVGKSDQDLWPPELAERFHADDTEVISTRQGTTVEQAIASANGLVWMETYRAPVLDEDGTLLGMVGAARNISERKAAEAAREAALAEAVRLARQRSDFLAQMSHELRTPLNAIMGYAQLLRRDTRQLTEQQAAGLATIHKSGLHLLTLINDILDMARAEAGKMVLDPNPTHLGAFLRVVVDIIRVKAEEKSLSFSYAAAADLPAAVTVDDKRLRQVLLNLLGNAVKFTDSGTVSLRVLSAPAAQPGDGAMARLRFEVADSGIGMSADQLGRIFQPFEQVAEMQRREGGTGLGLAISQQLIHLMGGNIEVKSERGKGSLFWFELALPVATGTPAILPVRRAIIGYEGARKRLLIVDDVPQNRAMLMDTLQALGFAVADARNGQECLELLDSFNPDLIVMDVTMPVMDGNEATRRIRQLPQWSKIPVIAVTANASHDDELACYAAGASAFLAKPVDHGILFNTIGKQLSLRWITEQSPLELLDQDDEEAADLVIPPAQEIEVLYQLARIGNMQKISERADHLKTLDPAYAPFAKRLHMLAQGYHSKALVAFVMRYQSGREAPPLTQTPA